MRASSTFRDVFRACFAWATPALLTVGLACADAPRTLAVPRDGDACEGLAHVFYLVAVNKDRGDSRPKQLEKAREGVTTPFAAQPDKTLRYWEGVIERVYRRPDASADEIRALAQASCTVNEKGQAVLLWPKGY